MPPERSSPSMASRTALPAWPGAKVRPRTRASIQRPVPPTTMGSLPRARISSTTGMAVRA